MGATHACCVECGREMVVMPEGGDEGSTRWYECPEHGAVLYRRCVYEAV